MRTPTLLLAGLLLAASAAPAAEPVTSRELRAVVAWQQLAMERQGLALQAYRQAATLLPQTRQHSGSASAEQARLGGFAGKPPAIVLDIDETVLDTMAFSARLAREGRVFDAAAQADWDAWVLQADAPAVPGAAAFIRRARALGFRVVFITNRECQRGTADAGPPPCPQKDATLRNLQAVLGYRPAGADLLMRFERPGRDDSDKQARRLEVARHHRIALLVGDDLNDFIRRADYRPEADAARWGRTWIVLPNPVYGSWERAVPSLAGQDGGAPPGPPAPAASQPE